MIIPWQELPTETLENIVTLCEGQFMRYVRTNFRLGANQSFEQQWRFLEPLFA